MPHGFIANPSTCSSSNKAGFKDQPGNTFMKKSANKKMLTIVASQVVMNITKEVIGSTRYYQELQRSSKLKQ